MKINTFIIAINTTLLLLFNSSAFAFDWNIKQGDQRLSGAQVKQMVFGKTVKYEDGSKELYKSDGSYKYIAKNGKSFPAESYTFSNDGTRCLNYDSGNRRCDLYVNHKGQFLIINSQGGRYNANIK